MLSLSLLLFISSSVLAQDCSSYEAEKVNEGYRQFCYLDSKGIPTIGVGCNMGANKALINRVTGNRYDSLVASGDPSYHPCGTGHDNLTDAEIRAIFNENIAAAASKASQVANMPAGPLSAVTDMIFNMGSVSNFPSMISDLQDQNWSLAAYEMVHNSAGGPSKFCTDTGARCQRDKVCMCSAVLNQQYCMNCDRKCPNNVGCCSPQYPNCCQTTDACCASGYPVCCQTTDACCPSGYPVCCDTQSCCPMGTSCCGDSCCSGNVTMSAVTAHHRMSRIL